MASKIIERLIALGTLKRDPAECIAIATRKAHTASRIVSHHIPGIQPFDPAALRWVAMGKYDPRIGLGSGLHPFALAHIPADLVLRLTQAVSGKQQDQHTVTVHRMFDNRQGRIIIDQEPIWTRHVEFHFSTPTERERIARWILDEFV